MSKKKNNSLKSNNTPLVSVVEKSLSDEVYLINKVTIPKSKGSFNNSLKVTTPKGVKMDTININSIGTVAKKVSKKVKANKRKREKQEKAREILSQKQADKQAYSDYLREERQRLKAEKDKIKALEKEDNLKQKAIRKEKTEMYKDLFKEVDKRDNKAYKDYIKKEKELEKAEKDKIKALEKEDKLKQKAIRKEKSEMYKDLFEEIKTTEKDIKEIENIFKSGGTKIDLDTTPKLTEREELLKLVNNLITKVNNKGINFKRAGLEDEFKNRIDDLVGDKKYLLTESGNLSKNQDILNDLSTAQLQNYRRALEKLQTSNKYSTPSTFKKFAELQKTKMDNAVKRILGDKVYGSINEYNVDDLYKYLNDARANGKEYLSSEQSIREYFHELLEDDTEEMELLERDMRKSIEAYERRSNFTVTNKRGGNTR